MVTEKALLIIESYNLMGYDAIGIGDDDLSLGKEFLMGLSKKAHFPFLSSNLINDETGKPLFQPYLLKEINGLRIGIFSLLSQDFFTDRGESRTKGLTFSPPIEVAQNMVKQLQPKTDIIILLSHLGYSKDMEVAQSVPGIHIIVGSHTGINLYHAPIIKNTILLQTGSKGMYGGRFDLTFYNNTLSFFNSRSKKVLEESINNLKTRLSSKDGTEMERAQWQKSKEQMEKSLEQLQGKQEKNEFTNIIIPLNEKMEDHPGIKSLIETYKEKFMITVKPVPTK